MELKKVELTSTELLFEKGFEGEVRDQFKQVQDMLQREYGDSDVDVKGRPGKSGKGD